MVPDMWFHPLLNHGDSGGVEYEHLGTIGSIGLGLEDDHLRLVLMTCLVHCSTVGNGQQWHKMRWGNSQVCHVWLELGHAKLFSTQVFVKTELQLVIFWGVLKMRDPGPHPSFGGSSHLVSDS
jgi:hypothetical protein